MAVATALENVWYHIAGDVMSYARKQKINEIPAVSSEISFDGRSLRRPHDSPHILYIFRKYNHWSTFCHWPFLSICIQFLQRVSIACYVERCISYSKSVRLSVTRWHCVKTAQAIIMLSSPEDSPMTRFLMLNFTAKFQRKHRERGRRMREGWEK